jgi:uncharacterized protein (DUF2236 family)
MHQKGGDRAMTCPVSQQPTGQPVTSDASNATTGASVSDVADRFQRMAGSVFVGLFGGALFDQARLPAVSAALEATGRVRYSGWARALRTAASDQLVFLADEVDSHAESERIVRLHRDVKGVDADGVRYSALNPESWNWILISTFFMHRGAFIAVTGEQLSAADNQAIWDRFRHLAKDLQLPGCSALVENYDELCAHYDQMAAETLEPTTILKCVVDNTLRPARPDFLPAAATPAWMLTGPLVGHALAVLGFGIMHPGVRALVPMKWTRRHDLEFAALTTALRIAYRWLPTRLTDSPLARNRREYQRLIARYKGIGLTSFAPDHRVTETPSGLPVPHHA